MWVKVRRTYLWFTILLLNDGQWQLPSLLLTRWRQTAHEQLDFLVQGVPGTDLQAQSSASSSDPEVTNSS